MPACKYLLFNCKFNYLTTDSLTIGGQTLRNYIASVVEDLGYVKSPIVSPIAEINEIHTNLITPIGDDSASPCGCKILNSKY